MKRVVITGATGFVGANLAERLVHDGHSVYLLLREGSQSWRIEHLLPHLRPVVVNLLDRQGLKEALKPIRPDWIFHLAAYGAYAWQEDLDTALQTNFLGTINLVEACREIEFEAFINTGSSSEYGLKGYAPSEDDFLNPNSYYAVTKASATLFCGYIAQSFNLPIYTLRLYSVYGPYEDPRRLIPTLILKGLESALPPLVHPEVARDFIFTEDVNNACMLVASRARMLPFGSIYNVGTGRQTTLRNIVELTRRIFDISSEPQWSTMEGRSWDTNIWVANNSKLRATGWKQEYEFEDGYSQTIAWFRNNPRLVEKIYHQQ
jgi:nucleoside-diphosphate-sugar epimerase